ncbi:hypothetical protein QVD17_18981 [Tagetes erecta]|uniref:Uncharacterized protein n=1 Tax=Tagetes erecta TaxID=13708 RepID=A0AAD8KIQ0_TARER|nr:hypothetical protein QVD17_18981 [Tagetes erecta]
MNGILHPCFHPSAQVAPASYEEIFHFIYVYIDRVFSIVRPRKLLFLAVDGVAPRAKMNHQRIRRFNSAKEAANESIGEEKAGKKLDSNVITPGTEFMDLLSHALKYYVYQRVNTEPGWRGIKVILSDSTVVGEGEDKIMSYIRSQRNLPGYDPNTRHCLHGLDADLILLSLATHEIHISILRETKALRKSCRKKEKEQQYSSFMETKMRDLYFEFFNIWVFREYLETELLPNVAGVNFDRLIDDFVLMCMFVGNDYLPHLPSFDISKGGIELLLKVYQHEFVKTGYLTNAHEVNLKSVEHFLQALTQTYNHKKHSKFSMKRNMKKRGDHYSVLDSNTERILHYTVNFNCQPHDIDRIKRHAVLKYIEGICWVMHFYYQNVPSWQWFYPYHYAPLASDFCGLDKLKIEFTLGQPFKPLDQLLGVLPAASAQALPLSYRELMISKESPILDFYPEHAEVDRDGKRFDWQGVCKLPFIDESRLLSEILKLEHTLTDDEKQRNRVGRDRLFVHSSHPLANLIEDPLSNDQRSELQIQIRPDLSDGMNGHLCISDKPVLPFNVPSPFVDKPAVEMNSVKSVDYKRPSHAHIPKLLHGVIMPPRILRCKDRPFLSIVSPYDRCGEKRKLTTLEEKNHKSDHCVNLAATPKQGERKDQGNRQNVINDKSEGSQNNLSDGKLTNPTEVQQQFEAGNGGMSDETQRVDTQVKGTQNERLIKTGICEKLFTEGDESLGDVPKTKRRRKNKNKNKLEADGEVPQGIKNTVNNVEEPIGTKSSNNQQEDPFEKKTNFLTAAEVATKTGNVSGGHTTDLVVCVDTANNQQEPFVKDEMLLTNGAGGNKMESLAAAVAVTDIEAGGENKGEGNRQNVVNSKSEAELVGKESQNHLSYENSTNLTYIQQQIKAGNGSETQRVDTHVKGTEDERSINTGIHEKSFTEGDESVGDVSKTKRRRKNKNKKKLEAEVEMLQGFKITVNKVEKPTIRTESSNNQQESSVALTHTKVDMMLIDGDKKTESLAAAEVATNDVVANENPTNMTGSVSGRHTSGLVGQIEDKNMKEFQVNVEAANKQEPPVALKRTKRKRVKDDMLLTSGAGGNKMESLVAGEAVTDIEVGGENKDEGIRQNVVNSKSEAELVVEGNQNHLSDGKLTNPTEIQQQYKARNGGMSVETQIVDTQGKGTEDERLINTGICEKPSTGADESLGDVPKSKRRRKNKNKKKLEAEGHEAAGEAPQGIKITVNTSEEPTITTNPSYNLQEHPIALKDTKDEMMLIDGEKKTEFVAAAKVTANVEDESLGDVPRRKQRKKNKSKKKLETEGPGVEGDVPQGITVTVKNVEEPNSGTKSSNNQQENHVSLKHTKDEMMLIDGEKKPESLAPSEVATNVLVANENPANKVGSVSGEHKTGLVVGQMNNENMNIFQQEASVDLKHTKKRRAKDEMLLTNGNKMESLAAAEAATDIEDGGQNPTNKVDSVGRVEPTDSDAGQVKDENMNDFLVRGLKANTKMVAFGKKR